MASRKIEFRQDGHPHTPFTWHHSRDNPQRCDRNYWMTKFAFELLIGICSCKDEHGRYRQFVDGGFIYSREA